MEDLLLIRRLKPYAANTAKRLVKSPKLYIRDTGLLHALLGLRTLEDLLAHPVVGASFEAVAIEALITAMPDGAHAFFYRTQAGAEIDLVVDLGNSRFIAVEIKSSTAPSVSRGFHSGCEDLRPLAKLVVYPGQERFPMGADIEALPIQQAAALVASA
jgi:predicted AAA+ superfamily ATPase